MIGGVRQAILYVEDQGQAKEFWTTKMGFPLARDEAYGEGQRWIEIDSPDGHIRLVLSTRLPGWSAGETPEGMPTSNVMFYAENLEQTHQELAARGVKFPTPPAKMHFGWWSVFEDNEGTRYGLTQKSEED
ncbi:VOC family protein [Actinocrispum wychmicini]|uniref:Glyoxalase/bleomycin resistance protein/dioxygenase superfamily protein n=1 Tax=Actinocrispum wychmicini TaxID=1213861 RepID=A0A4R2K7F8_9PSEU|nr:VOC family protein [Actinocrispum wychmicini]TCO65768.1 glyoxalase/bleomycin resistance protein/dioxygenase superfamily protein [Actinocrispum wychmicini]